MKKKYILFLIPLILYVAILGVMPQMEPDETRYSLIASAMNESGNYVTPHIKHTIYLEKPPLVSWMTALAFKVFGENDFSARLFSGLCAWGCIILTFFIGRRFRDERTGLYAAAVLTISVFPFVLGRINILDMPLAFFLCLSIWLGYLFVKKGQKRYLYLTYLAGALAFLTKGMIGIVLPAAILFLWLCWTKQFRIILQMVSPVGIIIFLVVSCPWIYLAQKENSDFLWFFFVREHFLRFTTKMHGKAEPFYYFLPIVIAGTLPWSVFLIRTLKKHALKESLFGRDDNKFLLVWFLFIFLFFSVSSSKLASYMAPIFLPLALFAGNLFRNHEEAIMAPGKTRNVVYRLAVLAQSLIAVVALLLPPILKKYSDPAKGLVVMTSDGWWIYILPTLCTAVLLTFLPDLIGRKTGKNWFLTLYVVCAVFLAGMVFPLKDFLYPYRSALVASEAVARYVPKDQLLYQYRENFYGIDFYNKIRTAIVEDFGELGDGIVKMPMAERKKYFLSRQEFFDRIRTEKEVYCLTQHRNKLMDLTQQGRHIEILWNNGAFYLLKIKQG